jgi:hypothetical protein
MSVRTHARCGSRLGGDQFIFLEPTSNLLHELCHRNVRRRNVRRRRVRGGKILNLHFREQALRRGCQPPVLVVEGVNALTESHSELKRLGPALDLHLRIKRPDEKSVRVPRVLITLKDFKEQVSPNPP